MNIQLSRFPRGQRVINLIEVFIADGIVFVT